MKKKNLMIWVKVPLVLFFISLVLGGCSKDEDESGDTDDKNSSEKKYELVIENGAQTIGLSESLSYKASLVDKDGNITSASGVSWTTASSSVANINSSGLLTPVSTGNTTVEASLTVDGASYSAAVPIAINMVKAFEVIPSAIIWEASGDMQLETVYFSTNGTTPTYTFSSSDDGVASVSNSGLVTFNGTGECKVTVTATNLDGSPSVEVPILVVGPPEITLPVKHVEVDPKSKDLFKDETVKLTAKAYNSENTEVSATFTWSSTDKSIATVNNQGVVTPVKEGKTYIQAQTKGIIGQAEIIVNPDTLVVVEPFSASVTAGGQKQYTATAYEINRTSATEITGVSFNWNVPTYGFSMLDIVNSYTDGLIKIKPDATPGLSAFVYAEVAGNPDLSGGAMVTVGFSTGCDCGQGNADVNTIEVSNGSTIDLDMQMNINEQINAKALDGSGVEVTSPALVYCSDNDLVASVTSDGLITAVGDGTTTITICSGTYAETTITVNVDAAQPF